VSSHGKQDGQSDDAGRDAYPSYGSVSEARDVGARYCAYEDYLDRSEPKVTISIALLAWTSVFSCGTVLTLQ